MLVVDHLAQAIQQGLTLSAMFEQRGASGTEGMAFLGRDGESRNLPYAILHRQAVRGARLLARAGVRPGDPVVLCCDDEQKLVLAFWSVLFAGGVAVPLSAPASYAASDEGLNKIVAVYRQCVAIGAATPLVISDLDPAALARVEVWRETIGAGRLQAPDVLLAGSADEDDATLPALPQTGDADALAMLMFSSGSTGDPKGVRLTHRQLISNIMQVCERTHVGIADRSLSWLPLTHDMGLVLFHICHALTGVAQYKTTPLTFARDPAGFLDLVTQHGITLLGMPNFGFDQLLRVSDEGNQGRWNLASVRVIYNGAEPIDPQLCRRFSARFGAFGLAPCVISPGWGIAEASVAASAFDQDQLAAFGGFPSLWIDADCLMKPGGSIAARSPETEGAHEIAALGPPMTGMRIRVLDDQGVELPPSHLGHLEFSGPNVSHGYFGQPDSAWSSSGDLGFLHDGVVYITGRAKDILFINGRNYYSNDLELALTRELDWAANQLAVVGVTDGKKRRERIVVFFRKTRGADNVVLGQQLRAALEALLAYPVAGAIGVASLPKTTSGKIRRFALRQALANGEYEQELAAAAQTVLRALTDTEARLATLLRALIPDLPDEIDPLLPLSRYGLDSVGYMQLAFRAGKEWGRSLAAHALLRAASLERIAVELDAAPAMDAAPQRLGRRVALTARQTMLWTAWLLAPGGASYNENYWIKFSGPLDPDAWLAAARTVVARHGMLGAVVADRVEDDEPGLLLQDNPPRDIAFDPGLESGYGHAAALQAMSALGARPFDLRHGPLLRLRLLREESGNWFLFLSAHHIVVDGWSLHLLVSQIFDLCAGAAPPVAESGLWHQPQSFDAEQISHWQARMDGAEAILLPSETATPATGPTAILRQTLAADAAAAIADWQTEGFGSQFSALAGVLFVLLARLANVRRALLVTVAGGRNDPSAQDRVGYFALTLPMTVEIDPDDGFDQLLAQIERQRNDILAGRTPDLPALERRNGASIIDAVRVVYVHQNMPALRLMGGLTMLAQGQLRGLARADLYVTSAWQDGRLVLDWEYDSGRLGAAQIAGYAELFGHALTALFAAPGERIGALDLLSPAQRALWRPYQDTAKAIDFSQTVVHRFERAVRDWPGQTALSDSDTRLTYAELLQKVDALLGLLGAAGLTQGARVCLLTERSVDYVIALLAGLKIGAVVVPIDPALPQERIRQIAFDSGAAMLLTTPGVALPEALAAAFKTLCFSAAALEAGSPRQCAPITDADPAYLIFTSGTTGGSKGVENTHRCLSNLVAWVAEAFGYRAGETICQFAPFSFDVSIAEILPSLCAGLHIHVLPTERRNAPELYLQTMREQRVNIATVTPAYLAVLNEIPECCRASLGALRLMILGGEALKTEEVRRFREHSPQVRVMNVYGPTETTVLSTAYPVPERLDPSRPWQPLGLPIANTEVWVLDDMDRVCPATVTGTIFIAGDGLGRGYWQDPGKTAAAFRMLAPGSAGAEAEPPRRFYCSGDLARLGSTGLLEFVGRADNQIKLRGFRIELGEIEATLERHAQVDAAVVKAVEREGGERVLVAYYSGAHLTRQELDGFLRVSLPTYMVPSFFQYVSVWPMTDNRKIDRKRLPEPDWLAEGGDNNAPPQGAMEQGLAKIWGELLGLPNISRDESFFLLGGNSLSAVRLVNRVRQQFGRSLALAAVMKNPSLGAMARQIELAVADVSIEPERGIAPDTEVPATEAQARLVFLDRSHPGKAINNIPLTLALAAPLDPTRLGKAALALAAYHPSLRARFQLGSQGLTMCFGSDPGQVFESLLAATPALALELANRFHQRPFDTERGPLWRLAYIHAESGGTQWLALSLHHSIADGVTLVRFLSDLDQIYRGDMMTPVELEYSYQDYSRWLDAQLQGQFGAAAVRFWSDPAQAAPIPALPLKRLPETDVQGRESVVDLDRSQTAILQGFCQRSACTPFVLMLSLFGFVLGQRIGSQRFSLGVTLNGRSRQEFELVPGIFVNTLPLTFQWSEQEGLDALANRVKTSLAHLQEFGDFPLNRVVSVLGQKGTPFNVLFNEEVLPPAFSFNGQGATLEALGTGTAKFPLLVSFLFGEQRWSWRMESRQKELADKWIEGLLEDVQNLISAMDGMADATLGELVALDADLLAMLG